MIVIALTLSRKSAYSRMGTAIGKLTYMTTKKKRELDPRAVHRGRAIFKARTAAKLSQGDIASSLNVSREAVSNWEHGKVGEIERAYRLGLCKLLGFEEFELLLDPQSAKTEFEMPLSREAKAVAHIWEELPETLRVYLKGRMAQALRIKRDNPELAKHLFPELDQGPAKKLKK